MKHVIAASVVGFLLQGTAAMGPPRIDNKDKMSVDWMVDEEKGTITFELSAKTEGWLGIAWSSNDGIAHAANADSVIAWVDDKDATVKTLDSIGTGGQVQPKLDAKQDLTEVSGEQKKKTTTVKFTKKLNTGDAEDTVIIKGPMRISWAYGTKDGDAKNKVELHKEWATYSTNLLDGNATVVPVDDNLVPEGEDGETPDGEGENLAWVAAPVVVGVAGMAGFGYFQMKKKGSGSSEDENRMTV